MMDAGAIEGHRRNPNAALAWERSVSDARFLYELAQAPTVLSGDDRPRPGSAESEPEATNSDSVGSAESEPEATNSDSVGSAESEPEATNSDSVGSEGPDPNHPTRQ